MKQYRFITEIRTRIVDNFAKTSELTKEQIKELKGSETREALLERSRRMGLRGVVQPTSKDYFHVIAVETVTADILETFEVGVKQFRLVRIPDSDSPSYQIQFVKDVTDIDEDPSALEEVDDQMTARAIFSGVVMGSINSVELG